MVTVSNIQFKSFQFCPESSFAAFQSISRVKDSSRLECVPRDFLLSVFCAKWKWEMKNITTFPKNGNTSKNTGSIIVTLHRYRKYTYTTYQDSLPGCSMYLRRFNGKWERNKLARARTQGAREEKVPLLSPSRAPHYSFPSLQPLWYMDVSSALEEATLSTGFSQRSLFQGKSPSSLHSRRLEVMVARKIGCARETHFGRLKTDLQ